MAMEKIRKLVLFYLDVFVFIFKATSLSVFYTVKCHPRKIKLIIIITLFYNLQEVWFPGVFHLFFFFYISECDKSNKKTGSYFCCSFPHFKCLTGGSPTLTNMLFKAKWYV